MVASVSVAAVHPKPLRVFWGVPPCVWPVLSGACDVEIGAASNLLIDMPYGKTGRKQCSDECMEWVEQYSGLSKANLVSQFHNQMDSIDNVVGC